MKKDLILGRNAEQYQQLRKQLRNLPLLAQGNVFAIPPPQGAPRASTHYKWTRKVKAKTVTEALSKEQYEALKAAIEANKQVEQALRKMRQLTQDTILRNLPQSPGKRRTKPS
jgi:hypothetical protein